MKIKSNLISIAFIDQVFISGSNFFISIILLRFLGLEIFGVSSFFWLGILFINLIQLSYIISQMITNAGKQSINNLNF